MRFRYHPDLTPLLVSVDDVRQHPENVNNGDLDAIMESIQTNGFTVPLVVQRSTGHIIAGNHRYQAVIGLGAVEVPVVWVDMDDIQALRYMIADNRTARLGQDDYAALADLLEGLQLTDIGLVGTGFNDGDLDILRASLDGPLNLNQDEEFAKQKNVRQITCPNCGHEFGGK